MHAKREHELGARQRERTQQEVDLVAEPAARHEHEPLAPLGELIRELHRDAATERLADQVARSCPSANRRSRRPLANAPSE